MAIRILRLIEYVYEDEEHAAEDRLRWTMTKNTGRMRMRSAVLPFESVEWEEPDGET